MDSEQPSADVAITQEGPSGVGGWLLLLVIGLVIGPVIGAGRTGAEFLSMETQHPTLHSSALWKEFKAASWFCLVAIAALSAYAGFGLARGNDWSVVKRAQIILWLTGPVGALMLGAVVPLVTLGASGVDSQFAGGLLVSAIPAVIWTAYLSKSKRVRNTYGPPPHDDSSNASGTRQNTARRAAE